MRKRKKRISFRKRYPNFPLYVSVISLILVVLKELFGGMHLLMQLVK